MNTVKVRARKGFWRVCVAALFSLAITACGGGQDGEAMSPTVTSPLPTAEQSGEMSEFPAEWLSDTPIDPAHAYVEGIDTHGLVELTAVGPTHNYEYGKKFANCIVVYRAYGDGTFDVAIKPTTDKTALPARGVQKTGLTAAAVDPWLGDHYIQCYTNFP